MMTRNHYEPRYDAGPNLTPLVDVVLVVLIFLMLGGGLASPRVLLSKVAQTGSSPAVPQSTSIELRVLEDTSGSFIVYAPTFQIAGDRRRLEEVLAARQRSFRAAGVDPSQVRVVIRPSPNVAYQHVLSVYETAQRAHFTNVAFGATR